MVVRDRMKQDLGFNRLSFLFWGRIYRQETPTMEYWQHVKSRIYEVRRYGVNEARFSQFLMRTLRKVRQHREVKPVRESMVGI